MDRESYNLHAEITREIEHKRGQLQQLCREISELEDERELLALKHVGMEIGDKVLLTGTRFKGREATIVDAVCWTHGGTGGVSPTALGDRPPILVHVPGTKATHFKVSGRLWQPVRSPTDDSPTSSF